MQLQKQLAQVANDYREAVNKPNNDAQAQILRNRFVFSLMGEIEASYGRYEHRFRARRATAETLGDAGLLGVTAAAGIVGEAGIKDMLTAAAAAGTGTKLSAEKNLFNEEGTPALLAQMRAARGVIEAQIISGCRKSVQSYSLEEAWKDLNKYMNAGSIESAMIQLTASAGSQNADAQKAVAEASKTPATGKEVQDSVTTRQIVDNLVQSITPSPGVAADAAKTQRAADAITTILTTTGHKPADGSTPPQLAQALQDALFTNDDTQTAKLAKAIQTAPAEFGGSGK